MSVFLSVHITGIDVSRRCAIYSLPSCYGYLKLYKSEDMQAEQTLESLRTDGTRDFQNRSELHNSLFIKPSLGFILHAVNLFGFYAVSLS